MILFLRNPILIPYNASSGSYALCPVQAPEVLMCPSNNVPENKEMDWLFYNDRVRMFHSIKVLNLSNMITDT